MLNKRILTLILLAAIAVTISPAQAATNWGNTSGANARFGWTGGQNNTDRFGDPTVDVTGFLFTDTYDFRATPTHSPLTDWAAVTVNVADAVDGPADSIETIKVQEWGTFEGDIADFTLQASFYALRFDPAPAGNTGLQSLPNDSTIFDVENGTWYTERKLAVGDLVSAPVNVWSPVNRFYLRVSNTITVSSSAPEGTFFEKDGMRIIIPEPGMCMLVVLAAIPLFRRRK